MKNAEADDPMELVGVELPVGSEEGMREMAQTFAEEFVRSGFAEGEILALFQNPFYRGPHLVWLKKGEAYVRAVIGEALRIWRPERRDAS